MLMLKLTPEGTIDRYPYPLGDLMADHPNTSFALPLNPSDLADFGVPAVAETPAPEATIEQTVTEAAPQLVGGVWTQQWEVTQAQPELVAERRQALVESIDNACAAVYTRVGRFAEEYKEREAQALAYKAAGYTGAVPRQVAAFSTPAGVTPTYATDLILSQAAQLRGALSALGELRMRKYEVKLLPLVEASAVHAEVMAAVRVIGAAL